MSRSSRRSSGLLVVFSVLAMVIMSGGPSAVANPAAGSARFEPATGRAALDCCSNPRAAQAAGSAQVAQATPGQSLPPQIQKALAYSREKLPDVTLDMIQAAAREGKLVLNYMVSPRQAKFLAKFREVFPFIQIEGIEATGGQQLARFQAEVGARRGEGDVFQTSNPGVLDKLVAQNAVLKWVVSDDAQYGAQDKHSGYWYSIHNTIPVVAYRVGALKPEELEKLKTWKGVADPAFKGRIGMPDITSGGIVTGGIYLFRYRFGEDFWKGFVANEPRIFAAVNPSLDALVAGEVSLLAIASIASTSRRWEEGFPLRFMEASPSWGSQTPQFISALAPHPNAARIFQDWTFSKDAQELWPTISGAPSARKGVADFRSYVKEPWFRQTSEWVEVDWTAVGAKQKEIAEEFNRVFKKRASGKR